MPMLTENSFCNREKYLQPIVFRKVNNNLDHNLGLYFKVGSQNSRQITLTAFTSVENFFTGFMLT